MSSEHRKPAPPQYGIALGLGESLEPEELLQLPIFQGVSESLLRRNKGAVVRRRFKAGDIVCREGEFGSTAFYLLEGKAEVSISSPIAHVKSEGGARGFLSKLKSRLVGRQQDRREGEADRGWIPIDAPVDLAYDHPVADLGPGELFGEMTCMSFYPRSATVRAASDCTMLEMLRNILDLLQKNKVFRAQQEEIYRRRALDSHLRSIPMFASLTATKDLQKLLVAVDFIRHLREKIELHRYEPGQIICRQGESADSFYLIRIGFVRVSETHPGGELVLAYLGRGGYFGEIGLLGGDVRTATCTALDHVEAVRISGDDFKLMLENFPEIRGSLEAVARERQEQNRQRLAALTSVPLRDFLAQGLMEAQNLLLLDLDRCTRCDVCVKACADSHDGITRLIREGLRFDKYLVATSCRQCRDPLCMVGCPVGSIRRRNSLEIIIEDWCIGCSLCAKNCPYGNINMHTFPLPAEVPALAQLQKAVVKQKATTCDLCSEHEEPSCVYACPHDAAHRVDPRQFFAGLLQEDLSESPEAR